MMRRTAIPLLPRRSHHSREGHVDVMRNRELWGRELCERFLSQREEALRQAERTLAHHRVR